jgi:YfiH family protein
VGDSRTNNLARECGIIVQRYEDGLVLYRFESLGVDLAEHAVFTRLGGVSRGAFASLNLGSSTGDDEMAVAENHARVYAHMGIDESQVISPHQVHGNHIALVTGDDGGKVVPNTDGLITDSHDVALMLRFADCQPILLYDPSNHALGLVHAGWRGVALGIARRAVETMHEAFGTEAESLFAGLGPAIGPCCYTVGDNVAAAMGYALPDWRQVMQREGEGWRLDLTAANAQQLGAVGVSNVERARLCTSCRTDEFYSHRASGGVTGRFAVAARLTARQTVESRVQGARPRSVPQPEDTSERKSLHPPGFPAFGDPGKGRL